MIPSNHLMLAILYSSDQKAGFVSAPTINPIVRPTHHYYDESIDTMNNTLLTQKKRSKHLNSETEVFTHDSGFRRAFVAFILGKLLLRM